MYTTHFKKFKGEIENHVNNSDNVFRTKNWPDGFTLEIFPLIRDEATFFLIEKMIASYFSKPSSIVSQVYTNLRQAIIKGQLTPGQLLKEAEMQELFGVSRTTIREAVRLLEADNLVTIDAYKKKYVRLITHETSKQTKQGQASFSKAS